jgi:hypothetical protein
VNIPRIRDSKIFSLLKIVVSLLEHCVIRCATEYSARVPVECPLSASPCPRPGPAPLSPVQFFASFSDCSVLTAYLTARARGVDGMCACRFSKAQPTAISGHRTCGCGYAACRRARRLTGRNCCGETAPSCSWPRSAHRQQALSRVGVSLSVSRHARRTRSIPR